MQESSLPPGPSAGALTQGVLFHRDPLGVLRRCRARYGDVFTLRLPTARRMVVVADPSSVGVVAGADPLVATAGAGRRRVLGMASPRSVLGADQDLHRMARQAVAPAFTPQALEPHAGALAELAARHAAGWPRRRPFRMLPRLKTLADEVAVRVVLGVRDEERAAALVLAIRHMLWSPGSPPMPLTTGDRGLLGVVGERLYRPRKAPVERLLAEELRARRAAGGPADGALDVLSCLLHADPPRSDAEIVDEVVPLLMAGQEPAAIGLTWVLDRLARHPEAAARFAPGRDPASDAFVNETLRVRPAVHSVVRPLKAPLTVAGHELPAGVVLAVPIPLVHRDPRVFEEPDAFRPERFLDGPHPAAFVPFGGGARRCLGQALARLEIAALIPAILDQLRLRPVSAEPERQVVRATVLPPHRSAVMVAQAR
ncbi:MAG TPA: cytochrome P450 [Baekduia sp.]|nr:cytochrome P450 [Baekduia sp.]